MLDLTPQMLSHLGSRGVINAVLQLTTNDESILLKHAIPGEVYQDTTMTPLPPGDSWVPSGSALESLDYV